MLYISLFASVPVSYIYYFYYMFFDELLHMGWQRGLHVVGVVLDVVVLQDWLQPLALFLPALLGTCHFGRQALWREKRLLRWGELARFDDLFDCVLNGSALLLFFSAYLPLSLSCFCLALFAASGRGSVDEAAVSWCAPISSSSGST